MKFATVIVAMLFSINAFAADCPIDTAVKMVKDSFFANGFDVSNLKIGGGTIHVIPKYSTEDYSVNTDQSVTTVIYTYDSQLPGRRGTVLPKLKMAGYVSYAGSECILVSGLDNSLGAAE